MKFIKAMDVDEHSKKPGYTVVKQMREAFRAKMDMKKKKHQRQTKVSVKAKVISKGTSYNDKYEIRRKMRMSMSSSKTNNSGAAVNRLG